MNNNKILIIDDEQFLIDCVSDTLEEENYEIVSALNGKEGLDVFNKEQPILIILDIRMPVMDGIEFLKHLKPSVNDPYSVIVISGHGGDEDIEKCFELGVCSFIRKPYSVFELIGLVKHSILLKITQQELHANRHNLEKIVEQRTFELTESLNEKEILLKEIHHRVKNNLQIITSLMSLQSKNIDDDKYREMFRVCQNRINSIALVHEKLFVFNNFTNINAVDYIRDLATYILQSYDDKRHIIDLKLDIENVLIGIDTALPCGLVINELITNCLKYAFPGNRNGEITISLRIIEEEKLELIINDNGVGLPEDLEYRKNKSLGLELVAGIVENQLRGKIEFSGNNGTQIKIVFENIG